MYKKLINKHLSKNFVKEETHTSTPKTTSVQKKTGDFNKEYYKDVEKKMGDYNNPTEEDEDDIDPPKTNVEGETEEYHNEMEIRNGQEMLKYDNNPSETYKKRNEMALEGDPKMGNETKEGEWDPETGEGNGNTEEVWGSSGGKHTGKEIVKHAKNSKKKRDDSEYNLIQFGDDIEQSGEPNTRGKKRKIAVESKNSNNKKINKNMKKRLRFKKPFDGVGNALQLIPEGYKVDQKEFDMTDGNENYSIRWEGSTEKGKAVILRASDSNMVNEDVQKMKHLFNYDSKQTMGNLEGEKRLTENVDNTFRSMLDKTKKLMVESDESSEIEELDEGDRKKMINSLMEESELTEEEAIEEIGRLFGGPSKEEQDANREKLIEQINKIVKLGKEKGWEKIKYSSGGEIYDTMEELLEVAAKNKYRGFVKPIPRDNIGTLYIDYKKGLTGLQKLSQGSGGLTGGA